MHVHAKGCSHSTVTGAKVHVGVRGRVLARGATQAKMRALHCLGWGGGVGALT